MAMQCLDKKKQSVVVIQKNTKIFNHEEQRNLPVVLSQLSFIHDTSLGDHASFDS